MSTKIDLNCDLGESYGKYVSDYDALIMPYISSCNIACGFHSGDPATIEKTIKLALKHEVAIGAHPSYPDLQGFGRRVMNMSPEELKACVLYQVSALKGMTEAQGGQLHHVKPHGALYNHAAKDESTAVALAEALVQIDPAMLVYAPAETLLESVAKDAGLRVCAEVFADRSYENDLSLRSRSLEGAVLHDAGEITARLENMILNGKVKTYEGLELPVKAETVCLHSDTEDSEKLAKHIHDFLISKNVEISAP